MACPTLALPHASCSGRTWHGTALLHQNPRARLPAAALALPGPRLENWCSPPCSNIPGGNRGRGRVSCHAVQQLIEWDVVEYRLPAPVGPCSVGVGRVAQVKANSSVVIEPMEEEDDVWVLSDMGPATIAPDGVLRVLEADYSQRQDIHMNPHGEHAHDVYTLLEAPSPSAYRGPRRVTVVYQEGEAARSG